MSILKTFSINDILTKPMGERNFSTIARPDTILSNCILKIDDSKIIGSINYPMGGKCNNYFISDGEEVSIFGDFQKELFELTDKVDDLTLRKSFDPWFASYGDKVVAANKNGIFLQVIDINKKVIEKQRYYNKIKHRDEYKPDDSYIYVRCDDKFIYCALTKLDKEKTKKSGKRISDKSILVFDWDLNPIKKYHLATFDLTSNLYYLSEDGKSFYYMRVVEGEEKVIFKGKLE